MLELVEYEINAETLLIIPYGKNKSKVFEYNEEFIVNLESLEIIKNSCLYFGCTYEGRRESVKDLIGVDMKVPILIEESRNIIFFPTTSCINKNSIWVSFQNLVRYSKLNDFSTVLYFGKNRKIEVDVKFSLVDNQFIRCIKLSSFMVKRRKLIEDSGFELNF